jgi:hypothetical protein
LLLLLTDCLCLLLPPRPRTPTPQHKLLAADRQYQTLKERNHGELVRLNLQAAADFRRALGRFAAVSAQVAAAAAEVWAGVAEQFADASQEAQQQQS